MSDQFEERPDNLQPLPKKKETTAAHSHGLSPDQLDFKLHKLKNAVQTKSFKEGPHTEHHANTAFDIKIIESLKRIHS